jgi:excisionase family DNA binding protein
VPEVLGELELLDSKQVGRILGRHPRSVMRMANNGEIPHVRIGEHGIRFKRSDVSAWIEAHRQGGEES